MEYREGAAHADPHAPPGADDPDASGRGRWVCRQCDQYSFDSYYDMIRHEQTDCLVARHYQQPVLGGPSETTFSEPFQQGQAGSSRSTVQSREFQSSSAPSRIRQASSQQQHYEHQQYYHQRATPPPMQETSTTAVSPVRRRANPSQQTSVRDSGDSGSPSNQNVSFSPSAVGLSSTASAKHIPSVGEQLMYRPQQLSYLLTREEMNSLSDQDKMLCQSVSIFFSRQPHQNIMKQPKGDDAPGTYATSQDISSDEQAGSSTSVTTQQQGGGFRQPPAPTSMIGILGLQCVYCMSARPVRPTDDRPDPTCERVFPGSVETIGSSIYLMKERHFRLNPQSKKAGATPSEVDGGGCPYAPDHVVRALQPLSSKAAMSPEQQRHHDTMMLQSVCAGLAHRLGFANNHPYRTGVILEGARQYAAEPGQRSKQQQVPTYYGGLYESPSREEAEYRGGAPPTYPYGSGGMDRYSGRPSAAAATSSSSSRGPPSGPPPPRGNPPPSYGTGPDAATRPPPSFYYDGYGWSCPQCASIPYHMRAPGSFFRDPPSTGFAERHFSVCTGPPSDPWGYDRGGMPPPLPYPPGYQPPHYPTPPSYYSSPSSSLPPPGWRLGPNDPPPPYYQPPPYGRPEYGYPPYPPSRDARPGAPPEYYYPPVARGELVPHQSTSTDATFQAAIKVLSTLEEVPEANEEPLVLPEDRLLLTDYFYFVNKQLKLCRFTEGDRKTRGGKREAIEVGFGGLECRHCSGSSGSRKFFWSDVDRLANSFAEIPGHILKCRKCPENVKQSLSDLKTRHPEQMAKLPRGSQKVFFRRMWKRLHNLSGGETEVKLQPPSSEGRPDVIEQAPPPLLKQEELNLSTADVSQQSASSASSDQVLLSIPEDEEWLNAYDCFFRQRIEVFCATGEQVEEHNRKDTSQAIQEGQVGLRCACCSRIPKAASDSQLVFPLSLNQIHDNVRQLQALHFESCPSLSQQDRQAYLQLTKGDSSISPTSIKYYSVAAKTLGLYDSPNGGLECLGGRLSSSLRFPVDTSDLSRKRASSDTYEDDQKKVKI